VAILAWTRKWRGRLQRTRVERFFSTLKYEHLSRLTPDGDGNALAVNLFRLTYNDLRPHQALDERTPRAAYLAVEPCDYRMAFGGPAT
jgi:transposase InsO family protein